MGKVRENASSLVCTQKLFSNQNASWHALVHEDDPECSEGLQEASCRSFWQISWDEDVKKDVCVTSQFLTNISHLSRLLFDTVVDTLRLGVRNIVALRGDPPRGQELKSCHRNNHHCVCFAWFFSIEKSEVHGSPWLCAGQEKWTATEGGFSSALDLVKFLIYNLPRHDLDKPRFLWCVTSKCSNASTFIEAFFTKSRCINKNFGDYFCVSVAGYPEGS